MNTLHVQELQSQQEILEAFPVMKQLRNHLDLHSYLELVLNAQKKIETNYLHCNTEYFCREDR